MVGPQVPHNVCTLLPQMIHRKTGFNAPCITVYVFHLIPEASSSHTPVTRREHQRRNSTSSLAASVGLPCPFSPSKTQDGGSTEWRVSEKLSQANLDAITFPGIPQTGTGDGTDATVFSQPPVMDRRTRQSLSDASKLEDTAVNLHRVRAFSLEGREGHSDEDTSRLSPVTPTHAPSPPSSHLSSLRISESSLIGSIDQQQPHEMGQSLEDHDEVFLQNPAPSSPPPPTSERNLMEGFPPPPSPLHLDKEAGLQTVGRFVV